MRSPVQSEHTPRPRFLPVVLVATLALVPLAAGLAEAATARIAVASNFREAASEIGAAFESATGHQVKFSFGSTGQLFAQIAHGAPFDAFLAADQNRAERAVMEGLAVKGSRFTYAIGRIVLYSIDRELVVGPETLHHRKFAKLAIAEPALAPYGAAAMQVLRALSRIDSVEHRIVKGLNISQTFQFIHSGNAELGFVALSQVALHARGSRWIVPRDLHAPIAQDAVLLRPGTGNDAAKAFLAFLRGADTDAIRRKYGYNRDN